MNIEKMKELRPLLEDACGSLNAHGAFFKVLKETDSVDLAIEKIKNERGVNLEKLNEFKEKYNANT